VIKKKMLENVRWNLIMQMEYLQGSAGRTAFRMKAEAGNLADVIDQAAVEQETIVEMTIRCRDSRQLQEIQETIQRIDSGQFGNCARCGKAIAAKRLLLAPLSRLCATCKAKTEFSRNRGGRSISGYRSSEYYAA
jgi:DnaK suppressor protein